MNTTTDKANIAQDGFLYETYNSIKSFLPLTIPYDESYLLIEDILYDTGGISFHYHVLDKDYKPEKKHDKTKANFHLRSLFLRFCQKPPNA